MATVLAHRFGHFARTFVAAGAPLYSHLAARAADELEHAGPLRELLQSWEPEPERLLLPLRVLAAVHRWVLGGELPGLARHYPSAGGDLVPEGSWPLFRSAILDRAPELPRELTGVNQHNEVARAAGLSVGLLEAARATALPLRLREVGASAGLLLRWDRYRDLPWWPHLFGERLPSGSVAIVERRGCDLDPVDARSSAGALRLRSFVWADFPEHLHMLDDAIEIAREVPAPIDRADAAEWLDAAANPAQGATTVIFHSMMAPASEPASLRAMKEVIGRKASLATADAPVAYLRFETPSETQVTSQVEVRLTTWPGGEDRLLATSHVNGTGVRLQ